MIKNELEIISGVENTFSFPESTIDSFRLSDENLEDIKYIINYFLPRAKDHFLTPIVKEIVSKNFENFDFVEMKKYPLVAAYNYTTKTCIINMNIFARKSITNIPAANLFALLVYGYITSFYSVNDLSKNFSDTISDYLSIFYIKRFAKKYGLIGSYTQYIPMLRFLVTAYVLVSFFGYDQKRAFSEASKLSETSKEVFDIDLTKYDFSSYKDFVSALDEGEVFPDITLYKLVDKLTTTLNGVHNIPMVEDSLRFMATITASTVSASTIFPVNLQFYSEDLYNQLLGNIERQVI